MWNPSRSAGTGSGYFDTGSSQRDNQQPGNGPTFVLCGLLRCRPRHITGYRRIKQNWHARKVVITRARDIIRTDKKKV